MRLLAVCCHPSPESFHAGVKAAVVARLTAAGHAVEVIDLYAEGFDPVMPRPQWEDPRRGGGAAPELARHVDELRAAEGLILIYPTWWYGMPAMMKGWIDRVWQPGVAFEMEPQGGGIRLHMLSNIRAFAVVTTHGSPAWFIRWVMGAPGRKQVVRGLTQHLAKGCRVSWNALYNVDSGDAVARAQWRMRTASRLARFFGA